jgi:hypothetical protein
VFSGLANHISNAQLVPFISNMHIALWCLAGISLLGAGVSAARPSHAKLQEAQRQDDLETATQAKAAA